MTKKLIALILTLSALSVYAQTNSYFPGLTKVSIDPDYEVFFGYDKKATTLINKLCYELDKSDPLYCIKDSVEMEGILVAKFKNESLKDTIIITYDAGLSTDPGFTVFTKGGKEMGSFACLEFYILPSGIIYVSGHTNSMYNCRRKFQIQNDTIIEVEQSYYYVGLKSKTLKDITLYKNKTGNDIIAQLPKDYQIEVLLSESNCSFSTDYNFLVRTDFGLVGWLRLGYEDIYGNVVEGLLYAGD